MNRAKLYLSVCRSAFLYAVCISTHNMRLQSKSAWYSSILILLSEIRGCLSKIATSWPFPNLFVTNNAAGLTTLR